MDPSTEPQFDSHLTETWQSYFEKSKTQDDTQSSEVFHEQSEFRDIEGEKTVLAFYNKRHDVSRFFDTKDGGEEEEGADLDNSLDLDDDLNVFKKTSDNTDLVKANEDKILLYVDLNNESVIPVEDRKEGEDGQRDMEEELDASVHPVLINQYPLGENHSIMLLFAEEGLP